MIDTWLISFIANQRHGLLYTARMADATGREIRPCREVRLTVEMCYDEHGSTEHTSIHCMW